MNSFVWLLLFVSASSYGGNPYDYDKTQTIFDRATMVHLFEWKWTDIAAECERFLQHWGYGAVQVSPPNEHIVFELNGNRPWYIRYQPVSYKLDSRSGNEAQFIDMVQRCNAVGVRIVVDVVLNHMVIVGHKDGVDSGSSGSSSFDGTDNVELFPGVPYGPNDFNDIRCHHNIDPGDYQNNAFNVRECRLDGLLDLNQGSAYVSGQIVNYLNHLVDIGVAGFRADAAKHMWPNDMKAIFDSTKNLRSDIFGTNQRPFIVQEVIDYGGESVHLSEYLLNGRITNFPYGRALSQAVWRGSQHFQYLDNFGPGWKFGEDHDNLVFVDNHDDQRDDNPAVVNYKAGDTYTMAVAFMLSWPFGYPRVMSSYGFGYRDQGPPSTGAPNWSTTSPVIRPQDDTCDLSSGWICEHRWTRIRQMTKFRSVTMGAAVSDVVTDVDRIAYARESTGYVAINNNPNQAWSFTAQTTLPPGVYCNVYDDDTPSPSCSKASINVNPDGTATFNVPASFVFATHIQSRVGGVPSTPPPPRNYQTTVIFIKRQTSPGDYIFVRGGNHNSGCVAPAATDSCSVPMFHTTTVPFVYAEYLGWKQNDRFLDFYGAEPNQGTHDGIPSSGTPLAYSTNDPNAVEYQTLNKYGPDYWMVQVKMDCSLTSTGWFEFKGYQTPTVGYESNINQVATCSGSAGGSRPYNSFNHVARCGFVNVFEWNQGSCLIDNLVGEG